MILTFFDWASHPIRLRYLNAYTCPKPQKYYYSWFSLFRFRSPLLTESRLIGMFAISAPLAGLSILRKKGIGGGDIKLIFASGAFLGVELLLQGTAIAILLAGCYGSYLLLYKKEEILKKFPLGPFLSTGYILVLTLTEKSKTVIIH